MHGSTVVLVAFLTSVVTTGGAVYLVERYGILSQKTIDSVVPDFHGMLESDARSNANASHVSLFVAGREPTSEAKPGSVIRQSNAPGQHLPREAPVVVVLAEEVVKVPAVVTLPLAEATRRAELRGYTVRVGATLPDPAIPAGAVISQSPNPETVLAKGGSLTVQVSSGPGDFEMPKVLNEPVQQAKEKLEKLGLKPTIRWVAMAETPTNIVLNQKPAADEKVKPGTEVQLTACPR